ncbi:unnamed protein product [Caenorhabditis bovis]|uniref:Uncharacterized protein n=1 Tax=Caenorhabditis bovis TaxID=2654633 RepID=A0A8S1EJV6_9PELO|nr:unnamed protein product [Caenorhabditis bovis]
MPRDCYPLCAEKRDFMEVRPAKNASDFYRDYDPTVGVGTALVLLLFFISVTINGFIRCMIRKYRMHRFYKNLRETERQKAAEENVVEVVVEQPTAS